MLGNNLYKFVRHKLLNEIPDLRPSFEIIRMKALNLLLEKWTQFGEELMNSQDTETET